MSSGSPTHPITTHVLRALSILERLAAARQPSRCHRSLSDCTSAGRRSLLPLIESLEAKGYVTHLPDSRGTDRSITLEPCNSPWQRSPTAPSRTAIRCCARSTTCPMKRVALSHRTATRCWAPRVETSEPLCRQMQSGVRVPLHCVASDGLFLPHIPVAERHLVMGRLTSKRMAYRTLTDLLEAGLGRLATSAPRNSCAA